MRRLCGRLLRDDARRVGRIYGDAILDIQIVAAALPVELARSNITVNAVAIGAMATEMWDTVPDVIKETIYEKIPMHRACTTEEAARGVRFLAVEGAYITGHALNMNGGLYQG